MFFDSLAIQLNMGRPIAEAFVDAAGNSGDPELYQIFTAVAPKLRSGQSLPSCLKPYEERFPELVMCVLNVGEVSGGISGAAQRLADTYKQMVAMQRSLSNNSFSPVKILLILCFIDMVLVLIHELGRNGDNLSGLALTFTVVTSVGIFAATVIAEVYIARAILHQMYRWKPVRLIVDTIKLSIPGLGIVSRKLSAARWARSFAVLWSAGINISNALEVSSTSALNAHYEKEFRAAAVQTRMGRCLSDCLARTELLPPYLVGIIRSCEETGKMDDELLRVATEMEREALDKSIIEMNRIVICGALLIGVLFLLQMLDMLAG
jgi:type IV pilus assembly protein PilC